MKHAYHIRIVAPVYKGHYNYITQRKRGNITVSEPTVPTVCLKLRATG